MVDLEKARHLTFSLLPLYPDLSTIYCQAVGGGFFRLSLNFSHSLSASAFCLFYFVPFLYNSNSRLLKLASEASRIWPLVTIYLISLIRSLKSRQSSLFVETIAVISMPKNSTSSFSWVILSLLWLSKSLSSFPDLSLKFHTFNENFLG